MFAALLAACSTTSDALFGDSPAAAPAAAGADDGFTGTFMKNKVANFRTELGQMREVINARRSRLAEMRNETNAAVADYRSVLSGISGKLQQGTTPGNPELMDQWRVARSKLEKINETAFDIKRLGGDIDSDSSMIEYMVGSINAAYKIHGASEEDHRSLKAVEEEVRQTSADIASFSAQIDKESERQQEYVAAERVKLNDLALSIRNGRLYGMDTTSTFVSEGSSMFSSDEAYESFRDEASRDYGAPGGFDGRPGPRPAGRRPRRSLVQDSAPSALVAPARKDADGRPIAKFSFDRDDIDFQEPLYQAMSRALERNPAATFEVSGTSPRGRDADAKKYVRGVVNALTDMGLPANRIAITTSTGDVKVSEVRIYEK
jgi:hypothetical protein